MKSLDEVISAYVEEVYLYTFGCTKQTAKILGVDPRTVSNYLNKYPHIRESLEDRKDYRSRQLRIARNSESATM